jgi:peptide/nickel transport system permease protein
MRRHRYVQRVIRTLTQAVPTLLGILILNFLLLHFAPGDAADVMAAESGVATAASMAELRARFGLDQPIWTQLIAYVDNLAHFSLGYSARFNTGVETLIAQRLPSTLLLMMTALIFALAVGTFLGAVMATFVGRWPDRLLSILTLLFYSIPSFWIGLMLIVFLSVKLQLFPIGGYGTIGSDFSSMDMVFDRLSYLILPAISLSLFYVAIYARLVRASMLEVQSQDFVRTAVAKGLPPITVVARHVLRNAMLPLTTVAGIHVSTMLGGAVVVETVFGWPGLGRFAFESVMARDFSVLLGILFLSSVVVIATNLIVDLLEAWLDPRIEVD